MAKRPVKRNAARGPAQNGGQDVRRSSASGNGQRRMETRQVPPSGQQKRTSQTSQRAVRQQPNLRPRPNTGRQEYRRQPPVQHTRSAPRQQSAGASARRQQSAVPRRLTHSELRRRRRRRNLLMALFGLLVVGVGVALSLTVLFKVENFQVENMDGSTPASTGIYTEDAILGALGVPVGENMFRFSTTEKEKSLVVSLPYLERVEIRRRLPSTLVIRVEPAVETWCAKTDSGWLTLSDGLKIMAISDEQPQWLPALLGLDIEAPVAGYYLQLATPESTATPAPAVSGVSSSSSGTSSSGSSSQAEEAQRTHDPMQELTELLKLLQDYDLKQDCTSIQFGETNELYFIYQNRAKVLLGTFNNLDYKIKFAAYLLHNQDGKGIADNEQGTLDVSHQLEDGSLRPTWSPGSITSTGDTGDSTAAQNAPEPDPSTEGDTGEGDAAVQNSETGTQNNGTNDQTDTAVTPSPTPEPTAEPAG